MDLEPILALFAGYYLNGATISEADLPQYVDDAMNELEFLLVFILYDRLGFVC
jgi:alpha-L-arabinofuranosidase